MKKCDVRDNEIAMPTAVTGLPTEAAPPRKRWTRKEVDDISAAGLLNAERLELIEGELIDKKGKRPPHVNCVVLLHAWLTAIFGGRFVVQEAPIDVAPDDNPTNEPEPDLVVLNRDVVHFARQRPRPEHLKLVIEVSDTTVAFDLTTKARLYARAGIRDYWVLDIARRRMTVHRDPQMGCYTSVAAYGAEESVAPLAAPESQLRVADAFAD
ncbi:MAG TPA: Uma2 family endonuclease [Bryobacteraceae bacterium]|nr:Uma2 family endonuclease [Bryobacteraceae bacterium]